MLATFDSGLLAAIVTSISALLVAAAVGYFNLRSQGVALKIAEANKSTLGEIKVSVDGRLEAALNKIDRLEGMVATLTGTSPPPLVGGQSIVPLPPLAPAPDPPLAVAPPVAPGPTV